MTNPSDDPQYITRNLEPPITLGPHRLHYQYSVTVPQTYLTLVSVLQGIAFGVLLLSVRLPTQASAAQILRFMLFDQHLYLAFLASSLLILLIWSQFIYVSMFVIWPLSTLQTALIYLVALAEVITFREIDSIPVWAAGMGLTAIVGALIRTTNLRFQEEADFVSAAAKKVWTHRQKPDALLYSGLGILWIAAAASLGVFASDLQRIALALPDVCVWLVLALTNIVLIVIIIRDVRWRQVFLTALTDESDMYIAKNGVIRYKS